LKDTHAIVTSSTYLCSESPHWPSTRGSACSSESDWSEGIALSSAATALVDVSLWTSVDWTYGDPYSSFDKESNRSVPSVSRANSTSFQFFPSRFPSRRPTLDRYLRDPQITSW